MARLAPLETYVASERAIELAELEMMLKAIDDPSAQTVGRLVADVGVFNPQRVPTELYETAIDYSGKSGFVLTNQHHRAMEIGVRAAITTLQGDTL